jgi:hypothetical protein
MAQVNLDDCEKNLNMNFNAYKLLLLNHDR